MAIVELFSDRQKRLQHGVPDVYIYDEIPDRLRGQLFYLMDELQNNLRGLVFGESSISIMMDYNNKVTYLINKEYGDISGNYSHINDIIKTSKSSYYIVDLFDIYLSLYSSYIKSIIDSGRYSFCDDAYSVTIDRYENIISELNQRFINAGVGYQFENGQFIRIDNQFIHAEVVKPALSLLNQDIYESAQEEFMLAHKHYRDEDYGGCIHKCGNSIESVMKIICDKRGWQHSPSSDAANRLIDTLIRNGLIPDYLKDQLLGAVKLRNKNGGHGRGASTTTVPKYLAEFMIHQTAAMILMLVRAEEALGSTSPDNGV